MRIQHNIMAMNAYRNYSSNTSALSKNLEKLSSGYKINRAGDDAAGLAISEKMRAQITGLETAQKNAKDGISLIQTAEGALTEVHDMLNRMVELADQSANGTYDNETDRANLQKEFNALREEIDRIADASNFNGIKLLDGSLGGVSIKNNPVISNSSIVTSVPQPTIEAAKNWNSASAALSVDITMPAAKAGQQISLGSNVVVKFVSGVSSTGVAPAALASGITKSVASGVTTFTVDISKFAGSNGKQAMFQGIANAVNDNGGVTIAGQTFKMDTTATKAAAGKITLTSATVSGSGSTAVWTEVHGSAVASGVKNLGEAGFNAAVKNAIKAEKTPTVSGGGSTPTVVTPLGTVTSTPGSGAATTAITYDFTGKIPASFGTPGSLTIGSTTYVWGASATGSKVLLGGTKTATAAAITADLKTKLEAKVKGVAKSSAGWSTTVSWGSGANAWKATIKAAAAGTKAVTASAIKVGSLAPSVTTVGKSGTAGKAEAFLKAGSIGAGDSIVIGSKTVYFSAYSSAAAATAASEARPAGATVLYTGSYKTSAGASGTVSATKVATALAAVTTDKFTVAASATSGGRVHITLTEKTPGYHNSDALESSMRYDDASQASPSNASAGVATADAGVGIPATPPGAGVAANGGVAAAAAAPAPDAKGTSEITLSAQPKSGTTVTIGTGSSAVTFEFVANGQTAKSSTATVVAIGANTDESLQNLFDAMGNETLKDVSAALSADGKTITLTNTNTDEKANDAAPSISTAGGGLTLQIGDTSDDYNQMTVSVSDMHSDALGIGEDMVSIATQEAAQEAVKKLTDAINQVSSTRGDLGAFQNRLEHTINNLSVMQENIQDAESTIRDVDVAKEMMEYTKNNILIQSAQAMLAQANQVPQGVLQLLQ